MTETTTATTMNGTTNPMNYTLTDTKETPAVTRHRLVRNVFSVNVPEPGLADYIKKRAAMHPKGVSGYVRELLLVDQEKWQDMERLRNQALSKLTDNERTALGFPLTSSSFTTKTSHD